MGEVTTSSTPVYDETVAATEQQQPAPEETDDGPTFAEVADADADPDQPVEGAQADDDE